MMNWTGGEYTKVAPTKQKALLQQQKAHFARARAATASQNSATVYRQHCRPSQLPPHLKPSPVGQGHGNIEQWHAQSVTIPPVDGHQPSTGMDSQELRLLAKRQELLQRSDWLGLQVARPLRITFEPEAEKALIGRRRKIVKTSDSQKRHALPCPAAQRPQDLFDRLPRRDVREDSSINFKVGTDALTTQTQLPKLPAVNDPRCRARAPIELEQLSEEPMLLDSDDDVFEKYSASSARIDLTAEQSPAQEAWRDMHDERQSGMHDHCISYAENPVLGSTAVYSTIEVSDTANEEAPRSATLVKRAAVSPLAQAPTIGYATEGSTSSDQRRQYGKCWQKVLGVPTTSQVCASNAAVKSFANTSSSTVRQPPLVMKYRRMPSAARLPLPVQDKEPIPDSMRVQIGSSSNEALDSSDKRPLSRAADTVPQTLGLKPAFPTNVQKWSPSDAVWRQFIIGDDTSEVSE